MKTIKILLLIIVITIGIFYIFPKANQKPTTVVSEDIMTYSKFTISPDNHWMIYSNGGHDQQNLIAFDLLSAIKYNITGNTPLGQLLSFSLPSDCWSIDSKYCSIGDYYVDFTKKEPLVVLYGNDKKSVDIRSMPRTCSDCGNALLLQGDTFSLLSPNGNFIAKTKDVNFFSLVVNKKLSIVNMESKQIYKIKDQYLSYTDFHWSSDSKRLYFYQKNKYSYIEI